MFLQTQSKVQILNGTFKECFGKLWHHSFLYTSFIENCPACLFEHLCYFSDLMTQQMQEFVIFSQVTSF